MLFTLWGNYDNFPWNMMTIENSVMYTWKGRVTATLKPFSFVPMFEIVKAQVKATWNRIRGGTCQNYWSSTAERSWKKETQPLDCFQFVKVGASFYISPFPFSPYTLFLNWIYLGVLVVVHCILAHPSLELVIKHRRSYNCNNARVTVSHSGL